MQSLFEKDVYEVTLALHHITSCKDDLYIAVNVTYKKVKYLAVFESGKRIYMREIVVKKAEEGADEVCVM
jgi:acyl dehydratase